MPPATVDRIEGSSDKRFVDSLIVGGPTQGFFTVAVRRRISSPVPSDPKNDATRCCRIAGAGHTCAYYVCVSLSLSLSIYIYIYTYINTSIYLSIYLSTYLSVPPNRRCRSSPRPAPSVRWAPPACQCRPCQAGPAYMIHICV